MGKDLKLEQETVLEVLIDECGLCAVLQSLSSICDQKADHILSSYSDKPLSKLWAIAGGEIGLVVCKPSITAIGEV